MVRRAHPKIGGHTHPEVSRSPLGHNLCCCKCLEGEVEELLDVLRIHHTIKIVWDHPVRETDPTRSDLCIRGWFAWGLMSALTFMGDTLTAILTTHLVDDIE